MRFPRWLAAKFAFSILFIVVETPRPAEFPFRMDGRQRVIDEFAMERKGFHLLPPLPIEVN